MKNNIIIQAKKIMEGSILEDDVKARLMSNLSYVYTDKWLEDEENKDIINTIAEFTIQALADSKSTVKTDKDSRGKK